MKINNGGPAFPAPLDTAMMAALTPSTGALGMTLRDYFAAKVLQSMISSSRSGGWNIGVQGKDNEHISVCAYAVADSMLAARDA